MEFREYRVEVIRLVTRLAKSRAEAGALGALGCVEALITCLGSRLSSTHDAVLAAVVAAVRNLSAHPKNHGVIARRAAAILWLYAAPSKDTIRDRLTVAADATAAIANLLHSEDSIVRTYLYRVQVFVDDALFL